MNQDVADLMAQEIADKPLSTTAKTLLFLFCGVPGIAFAAVQEAKGRSRRADEAWAWVGYGWIARLVVTLLGVAIARL